MNVMYDTQKCAVMFEGFDSQEIVNFDDVEPYEVCSIYLFDFFYLINFFRKDTTMIKKKSIRKNNCNSHKEIIQLLNINSHCNNHKEIMRLLNINNQFNNEINLIIHKINRTMVIIINNEIIRIKIDQIQVEGINNNNNSILIDTIIIITIINFYDIDVFLICYYWYYCYLVFLFSS